jgi:hypothetical protein
MESGTPLVSPSDEQAIQSDALPTQIFGVPARQTGPTAWFGKIIAISPILMTRTYPLAP